MALPRRTVTSSAAAALAALALAGACAERKEEGRFCESNQDCEQVCHRFDRPEGAGSCGAPRRENEPCTRPGLTEHDCEGQLRCSRESVCVRGAWCPGACSTGEVCLSPDNVCVLFCSSDAECGDGCCQTLEGRGASICLSRSQCSSAADAGTDAQDAGSDAPIG